MTISLSQIRPDLEAFNFRRLFIEHLGWNRLQATVPPLEVNGSRYRFTPVAQQGAVVLEVQRDDGGIAPKPHRLKIERHITSLYQEHLLIYVDGVRQTSRWAWMGRSDSGTRERWVDYRKGERADPLLQRLVGIAFEYSDLDDEGRAAIVDVTSKLAKAFDVEKVTKGFYEKFRTEHDAFQNFLRGIDEQAGRDWYTSVMLNRLMFLYFIQKKHFLNGDPDYLQHRLVETEARGGDFYHDFLRVLFFRGLACEESERTDREKALLGQIPYLNGGLFLPHSLEMQYGEAIAISNAAFARLFAFFNAYSWHLDERPNRAGNEINPDVLGYIFEKYINQKQMGAYYTKEDITGYICRSTILPWLLEQADVDVRAVIGDDVTPYIHDAVATEAYLPTETEREYAARRARYQQIRQDYAEGRIAAVNDLITWNLDIETFTEDWLLKLDDPLKLRQFYFHALTQVTVLDPTCGSGAFLFAALNILQPLYELALDRMREFIGAPDTNPATPAQKENVVKYLDFVEELQAVSAHPNRRYFVLKRAIVNNLYGVDIMDEAVEICKLRLFLKLVAQVEEAGQIEPLPDIDFNIRAGNTLVGFATKGEIEGRLFATPALKAAIAEVEREQRNFRTLQTRLGIEAEALRAGKASILEHLDRLRGQLDQSLMEDYGRSDFAAFRASHKPFHWYVEFNSVMANGGFDVIVGNPPYVEYSKVKNEYSIIRFKTESCGNLYAYVMEQALRLLITHGRIGLIVPISFTAAQRMKVLQELVFGSSDCLHLSNFALRPASLFPGVMQRLTIILAESGSSSSAYTTDYITWYSEERPYLFYQVRYLPIQNMRLSYSIPKVNVREGQTALEKILAQPRPNLSVGRQSRPQHTIYYHSAGGYWIKTFDFQPYYRSLKVDGKAHTTISRLELPSDEYATVYLCVLNSSLFYFFWKSLTDARHLYPSDIALFPIRLPLGDTLMEKLKALQSSLMQSYTANARRIVYGSAEVDQYSIAPSKPIIDEIDRVLARHYGFTDEELDFIIHYDIKYRMGRDAEADGEE